jgi:hypothetical protein
MNYWKTLPIRVTGRFYVPAPSTGGYPLGEMRPWGMIHHRAGAYAREA